MKKITIISLLAVISACIIIPENNAEKFPVTKTEQKETRKDKPEEKSNSTTIVMKISDKHMHQYFGLFLPEFQAEIIELNYCQSASFQKDDEGYSATLFVPCKERSLHDVTLSLIQKEIMSISINNVPLNPDSPCIFNFDFFLAEVSFNVSINPNYQGDY